MSKKIETGRLKTVENKKKVLFFIYQMGAGGAARTLLNIMNNLDRDKFIPILVTLNYKGNYEKHLKADVEFYKLKEKRLRQAIFPLAKFIRRRKVDIVFSTIPNYNTIAILSRIFSFSSAKSIVREADNLGGSFLTDMKLRFYGIMYRFSSQIISLSEGVKENLVEKYKVKPDAIKVIYNPVDIENIEQQMKKTSMPEEHKQLFAGDEPVVITAGRLVKQKDQQTLIRAFAKVNARINCKLVILGEGELRAELKALANNLQIGDKVHFLGFQQNPYMYFKEADLFVLSSIHEGFGHVLAEALATGTPVVSTNCKSGPEEVLQSGKYGRLCGVGNVDEMAEQMYEVLTLPNQERYELINKGIQRASEFDAKEIVKQYEETFLQVANQENVGRRESQ